MSAPFDVLAVCTGNICRSPLAERMLAGAFAELSTRLGAAWLPGVGIRVHSAGTAAHVGESMTPETVGLVTAAGLDDSGHVARQLTDADIEAADLILALTREHRRLVVSRVPHASRYTFALPEFARGMEHLADGEIWHEQPGGRVGSDDPGLVLRLLVETMALRRGFVPPPEDLAVDDVVDPYLEGPDVYARAGEQVGQAVAAISRSLDRLLLVRS